MIEQISSFLDGRSELIVAFEEKNLDKFLVLVIIDNGDEIRNEIVLDFEQAEELFSILLNFMTEG